MTGKNEERGSWIHPDLAVQLAQWISPSFAIQVSRWVREIALTGKVEQGKEKIHDNLKRTRNYHKFKKGKCCYVLYDPWRTDACYKVGGNKFKE
jgi:hypothetical protein